MNFCFKALSALSTLSLAVISCCNENVGRTSDNPSMFLTDSEKIEMVHSLKTVDGDRFLEMDYTIDYDLDGMIDASLTTFEEIEAYIFANMMDVAPGGNALLAPEASCSAFAAMDPATEEKYMGRNYDFCHVENGEEVPITAIMVRTAPEGGKKSISMVDSYWLGYKEGFYNDGVSDLSMLVATPYGLLDGMNEDGLAVGVLHLLGNPTAQTDPTKKNVWSNVLMRVLLDRAGTVDEAIEIAKGLNMNMSNPAKGNNHFFLADANGDYAILEYTYEEGEKDVDNAVPNHMLVLDGPEHSFVTNFYVDPNLSENAEIGGKATTGKARYEILEGDLTLKTYKLTFEQARDLLKMVAQNPKPAENTSHTQWSALYNLSRKTLDISILQEFENNYTFTLE